MKNNLIRYTIYCKHFIIREDKDTMHEGKLRTIYRILCLIALMFLFTSQVIKIGTDIKAENTSESDRSLLSRLHVGDILFCDMKPEIASKLENIGLGFLGGWRGRSNEH